MKKLIFTFSLVILFPCVHAQLSVTKLLGKDSKNYRLGYDLFTYWDFPLNSEGNSKSIRLELMDLAMFPGKDGNFFTTTVMRGYISIKLGYKVIFSETNTGFYTEPSLGYARVTDVKTDEDATYGDGFAAAFEGGYNIEVGQRGHQFALGLKYEYDRGGSDHQISSLGFRLSYSFNMFKKRRD